MKIQLVYITTKNREEAQHIATVLVGERLAACANIVESIRSIYRWKGETHNDPEALLLVKTREDRVADLIKRARELHSYECPCIVSLPISDGFAPFLNWVAEEVAAG